MPTVRVIIEADNGQQTEQVFPLAGSLDTLDAIDEAVEQFKNQALPKLEQDLLHQAQERVAAQEKKTRLDPQRQ